MVWVGWGFWGCRVGGWWSGVLRGCCVVVSYLGVMIDDVRRGGLDMAGASTAFDAPYFEEYFLNRISYKSFYSLFLFRQLTILTTQINPLFPPSHLS